MNQKCCYVPSMMRRPCYQEYSACSPHFITCLTYEDLNCCPSKPRLKISDFPSTSSGGGVASGKDSKKRKDSGSGAGGRGRNRPKSNSIESGSSAGSRNGRRKHRKGKSGGKAGVDSEGNEISGPGGAPGGGGAYGFGPGGGPDGGFGAGYGPGAPGGGGYGPGAPGGGGYGPGAPGGGGYGPGGGGGYGPGAPGGGGYGPGGPGGGGYGPGAPGGGGGYGPGAPGGGGYGPGAPGGGGYGPGGPGGGGGYGPGGGGYGPGAPGGGYGPGGGGYGPGAPGGGGFGPGGGGFGSGGGFGPGNYAGGGGFAPEGGYGYGQGGFGPSQSFFPGGYGGRPQSGTYPGPSGHPDSPGYRRRCTSAGGANKGESFASSNFCFPECAVPVCTRRSRYVLPPEEQQCTLPKLPSAYGRPTQNPFQDQCYDNTRYAPSPQENISPPIQGQRGYSVSFSENTRCTSPPPLVPPKDSCVMACEKRLQTINECFESGYGKARSFGYGGEYPSQSPPQSYLESYYKPTPPVSSTRRMSGRYQENQPSIQNCYSTIIQEAPGFLALPSSSNCYPYCPPPPPQQQQQSFKVCNLKLCKTCGNVVQCV